MKEYSLDLHVHLGASLRGAPVKITASPRLNIKGIINGGMQRKGLDAVGIVDAASPRVLEDLDLLIKWGQLKEQDGGGLVTPGGEVIFLGSEVEATEAEGVAHYLAFFPYLEQIRAFSNALSVHITNINLSSQKANLSGEQLSQLVSEHQGVFFPAHAFTPFKSVYGSCASSLQQLLPDFEGRIEMLELGLSADTELASRFLELGGITFLSNSDAHSPEKIGREYNLIRMRELNFKELLLACRGMGQRRVVANYGLDPRLGKYHRTFCHQCQRACSSHQPPVLFCPEDDKHSITLGVLDRISQLTGEEEGEPGENPSYYYQLPLEYIPGLGKKRIEKLIKAFGSELRVLREAQLEELVEVVGRNIAEKILLARQNRLQLEAGGGGHYGSVTKGQ